MSLFVAFVIGVSSCSTAANKTANTKTETKTVETNTKDIGNLQAKNVEPKKANDESESDLKASSGDKIGIPECDDYIEKYEACINGKVPEAVRQQLITSFEMTRKSWKGLAANPQTRSTLASACKQSVEAAKKSMSAYQCDW